MKFISFLSNVSVMCLEVFALIVCVTGFKRFEDAMDMVNNSIYGLQAGVYTQNIANAFRVIKRA